MDEAWRVGRKQGRIIYIVNEDNPGGKMVGVMDSEELALLVARAVNHFLELSDHGKEP